MTIDGKSATTDANGYFSITGVSAGEQSLVITKTGAITRTISITVAANTEVSLNSNKIDLNKR